MLMGIGLCLAIIIGAISALTVDVAGERYGILGALPVLMIIGFIFLYDRYLLFLLIILFRSVMDPILDTTKIANFGLGAVLNALVILIAFMAMAQRSNHARDLFVKVWLPFLIIAATTLVIAPEFITGLKTYLSILTYAAVFTLAITLIRSEKDYSKWMLAVFLSSIIPVMYGFVDAATGGYISQNGFRIRSTFSHPNIFAFYLVLMISITFYFYKARVPYVSAFWRRTLPIYILMMLALLLMTKTRSAWAACFAFFTLYAVIYERKYLVFIALASLGGLLIPEVRDRLMDLGQGNQVINYSQLNSYAWRKLIWKDGVNWMAPSHYVLGYGMESFNYYSRDFFSMAGGQRHDAHSVFVQLFFETGLLGLAAFIWAHVKVAKLIMPFYKKNKLMIFSAMMFLFEFSFYAYADNMLSYLSFNWYLWFVLGAAYAVNASTNKEEEHEIEKTN